MSQDFYIAIEGTIGVGKTTLARLLQPVFKAHLLLEKFEENPFLSDFYQDRARYAFQTQIFFLLSRYRQQREIVLPTLGQGFIIGDYIFAKDRLFARLNLQSEELAMYQRVYNIMAENVPLPDLVIYLRAGTDVLMERIALRDRAYERNMDRQYIDDLRHAYERFFADYQETPLLILDTNQIDFVKNLDDLNQIVARMRAELGLLPSQPSLFPVAPTLAPALDEAGQAIFGPGRRHLSDLQRWHHVLDQEQGLLQDIYLNFIGLTRETGTLATVLADTWPGHADGEPFPSSAILKQALADCLAYLLKIANGAGIDLEAAYLDRMQLNGEQESK